MVQPSMNPPVENPPEEPVEVPRKVKATEVTTVVQESGGWKALVPPILGSVVLAFLMIQMIVMPKIDEVAKVAQTAQLDVNAAKTELAKFAGIQTELTKATTVSNNLAQEITAIKAREAGFLTSDKLTALQAQVTQLASTVSGLGSNHTTDIGKLKDQITALSKSLTELQATVNGTSTTTNGTTVVSGQVTPTIIGNPFTGVQYLKFDTTLNGTTATQTLSFQIANGTGKTINNLQLGILLQIFDVNGANYYTLPAGTTLGVMAGSNMMGTIWTEQSTGVSYYRGYTNSALTGMLGNVGAISQNAGIQTYSVTVSISNQMGTSLPALVIYPVVKVLSFN